MGSRGKTGGLTIKNFLKRSRQSSDILLKQEIFLDLCYSAQIHSQQLEQMQRVTRRELLASGTAVPAGGTCPVKVLPAFLCGLGDQEK